MKLRTIVVDNQPETRSETVNLLEFYQKFDILKEFADVNEAFAYLNEHSVDVLFASYAVGDPKHSGDGSFLVSYITVRNPDLIAVMYGADETMAYTCQCIGAAAFVKTPVSSLHFTGVIQRITYQAELLACRERSVMIKTKKGYQMVRLSRILFVERSNRRITLHCDGGEEVPLTGYTMDELEQLLEGSNFYRCYQSFLVNLDRVSFVKANSDSKNYALLLEGFDGEVILSRQKYNEVLKLLRDRYVKVMI